MRWKLVGAQSGKSLEGTGEASPEACVPTVTHCKVFTFLLRGNLCTHRPRGLQTHHRELACKRESRLWQRWFIGGVRKKEGESRHLRCALDGRELVTVQVGFILRGKRGELAGQLYRQQFRCQLHVSRL